ncbi:MAG TPA: magnesium transporter [Longimicrobiales bacterium]|nr:magnesium transporter [Longimicrobiales bacterium]
MTGAEAGRGHRQLAAALVAFHPVEAARLMERAKDAEVAAVLDRQPADHVVSVLGLLSPEKAAGALAALRDERTGEVLARMSPHRSSALLARLDPPVREQNLALADPVTAADLRALAEYPMGSAGSLMDPRVLAFRPSTSVGEAMRRLQGMGDVRIQNLFLVDDEGRLVGVVPLQALVLASRKEELGALATEPVAAAQATWQREAVLEELELHQVGSLPVVDFEGRLVGVLRQDQLLRTVQQQAAASLVSMVGAGREERALSSPFFVMRKRLPWLQINLVTAFLAASVVGFFESTIAQFTALAVLLPVVAGQSGNTGAQALAVTMRGLALREIQLRSWPRVAVKEAIAGCLNGIAVAATTSAGVFVWSRSPGLALVIGVSMVLSMTIAGLSGALVPIILASLKQDPAQSSSIVLTTITDVAGFFSFLGIATLLSGML